MNVLSLFTGYEGLGLALEIAGLSPIPLCYVERSIRAAALLADRIEKGALAPAPIWSDIRSFNGATYRGRVDILTAGYPCQDFSLAGKRAGLNGRRGKCWEQVRRIIGVCEPRLCFLENVPGHLSLGFERVLLDLAECGYDAEWTTLSTRDCGNSQIRKRLFCLAYPGGTGLAQRGSIGCDDGKACAAPERDCGELEHTELPRWGQVAQPERRKTAEFIGADIQLADAKVIHAGEQNKQQGRKSTRAGSPLFPPGPGDPEAWARIIAERPDLAPAVESEIRGMADGPTGRLDRLRMLGNGVEPLQAAVAFIALCRRAGIEIKSQG